MDQQNLVDRAIELIATYHPWTHTFTARTIASTDPYFEDDEVVTHRSIISTPLKHEAIVNRQLQTLQDLSTVN